MQFIVYELHSILHDLRMFCFRHTIHPYIYRCSSFIYKMQICSFHNHIWNYEIMPIYNTMQIYLNHCYLEEEKDGKSVPIQYSCHFLEQTFSIFITF